MQKIIVDKSNNNEKKISVLKYLSACKPYHNLTHVILTAREKFVDILQERSGF